MDLYSSCDDSIINYSEVDHLKLSLPLKDETDEGDEELLDQVIIFNVFWLNLCNHEDFDIKIIV